MDAALREELLALAEADQEFRRRWSSLSEGEIETEIEREHARTTRIAELVAERGWPGRSLVGDDGADAAWLLVQHADDDVDLQERCLELLAAAVAVDDASRQNLAYLTDRVRVNRGRAQVYGTQFHGRGDDFGPPDRGPRAPRRAPRGGRPAAVRRVRGTDAARRTRRALGADGGLRRAGSGPSSCSR